MIICKKGIFSIQKSQENKLQNHYLFYKTNEQMELIIIYIMRSFHLQ
jgi:hypothetical protein